MNEIADKAGVSRQLLYLHFDGHSDLMLELSRMVSSEHRTPEREQEVLDATTARTALRRTVELEGAIRPALHDITMAMDVVRHTDPAVAASWRERDEHRYQLDLSVARRLADEDELRPDWTVSTAARLIWAATSQSSWSLLVEDGDWSTARWVEHTSRYLELALCVPVSD